MIELHTFPPFGHAETGSPFGMKLALWFRMVDIAYEIVVERDPHAGPKGKVPWIVDGNLVMGDTSHIIEHYSRKRGIDLDAHLSATERAQSLAIQRLVEEHLHFCYVHSLFVTDEGWALMREEWKKGWVPPPMIEAVGAGLRATYRDYLHGQGLGRHSAEEIAAFGRADIDALAALLGDKRFVHGDRISNVDASVGGYLSAILATPYETPITKHARSHANLGAYVLRMPASRA